MDRSPHGGDLRDPFAEYHFLSLDAAVYTEIR